MAWLRHGGDGSSTTQLRRNTRKQAGKAVWPPDPSEFSKTFIDVHSVLTQRRKLAWESANKADVLGLKPVSAYYPFLLSKESELGFRHSHYFSIDPIDSPGSLTT